MGTDESKHETLGPAEVRTLSRPWKIPWKTGAVTIPAGTCIVVREIIKPKPPAQEKI